MTGAEIDDRFLISLQEVPHCLGVLAMWHIVSCCAEVIPMEEQLSWITFLLFLLPFMFLLYYSLLLRSSNDAQDDNTSPEPKQAPPPKQPLPNVTQTPSWFLPAGIGLVILGLAGFIASAALAVYKNSATPGEAILNGLLNPLFFVFLPLAVLLDSPIHIPRLRPNRNVNTSLGLPRITPA